MEWQSRAWDVLALGCVFAERITFVKQCNKTVVDFFSYSAELCEETDVHACVDQKDESVRGNFDACLLN